MIAKGFFRVASKPEIATESIETGTGQIKMERVQLDISMIRRKRDGDDMLDAAFWPCQGTMGIDVDGLVKTKALT